MIQTIFLRFFVAEKDVLLRNTEISNIRNCKKNPADYLQVISLQFLKLTDKPKKPQLEY